MLNLARKIQWRNISLSLLGVLSSIFFGFFGISNAASAATIFSQSDFSVSSDVIQMQAGGSFIWPVQYIGTSTASTSIAGFNIRPLNSSTLSNCSNEEWSLIHHGSYSEAATLNVFKSPAVAAISGVCTYSLFSGTANVSIGSAYDLAENNGTGQFYPAYSYGSANSLHIAHMGYYTGGYGTGYLSTDDIFYDVYDSGGSTPPPPADTSTRLLSLSPSNGTTTSFRPDISGSFYNQNALYNKLIINTSWVEPSVNADLLLTNEAHKQYIFDIGTSTSNQTFSTSTPSDLLAGRWLETVAFSNDLSGSEYFTATTTSFIVGTTTTLFSQFYDYGTTTSTTTYGQPISDCAAASSILEKVTCSIGDRIKDALSFLFVPGNDTIAKYSTLKDTIFSKVPFGYFNLVKNSISSASASSTPVFSLIIPLTRVSMFQNIRTVLSYALLLWWIVHTFQRFKNIII